jgi:16S rRNA (cytidine1402-2'-O)-methyltransferase
MTLYVVATPIGNLGDLSARAIEVLRSVDGIVAEDTRHTRGLLTHFEIQKPLLSLPAFDERNRIEPLIERLKAGESLALVTDAGTPAVSDPGEALVDAAWAAGVNVVPIPGASAAITALSASGLRSSRFAFLGFLPRKGEGRREAIDELRRLPMTAMLYEAGNRTGDTLKELALELGPRRALVARELTKFHEELTRGSLAELAERFKDGARGEVVIVVEEPDERAPAEPELPPLEDAIRQRLAAGGRIKEIAQELATAYRLPRQQVYTEALRLRSAQEGSEEA